MKMVGSAVLEVCFLGNTEVKTSGVRAIVDLFIGLGALALCNAGRRGSLSRLTLIVKSGRDYFRNLEARQDRSHSNRERFTILVYGSVNLFLIFQCFATEEHSDFSVFLILIASLGPNDALID